MSAAMAAIRRLASVLTRENTMLAALDLGAVGALAEEKAAALADVAAALAAALAALGPVAAGSAAPGMAGEVRALAAVAAENKRLLERALAVQGRVIALVVRAAAPAVGNGAGAYRMPGRRMGGERPAARVICGRA